ncbi:organic cation transporter protein-like [Bombyx mandarina]|uniref:Organic cation transporter protein-like n=1 Tax=Bombyx mandarina TaxID=7092 RepID=A0A6J2JB47_BOMMA|nr:organic cation transporter protein-like [Bombyx mandarina]
MVTKVRTYGTSGGSLKCREPNSEDLTAKVVGDFGKWQLNISLLMALLKLPLAWYQLNIIFMAPPQDFWCAKPDSFSNYSEEEWRSLCSPDVEEHPCLIYDPDILVTAPNMDRSLIPLVACTKFIYDQSLFRRTIISDWNLVCTKHWLIHLTQCVMMWGVVVGGILFGIVADKYGRKIPLVVGLVVQTIASYIVSVIPWYWSFLTVWFVLALASGGIGIISFVVCMEVVSGKYRTTIPILYQLPFGLGSAVMASLAYWLRDWRKLEFALATFSSLFLLYWFWIPESPRWLLATGQTEKAIEILREAAKKNGRNYDPIYLKLLVGKLKPQISKGPGFLAFFKSKNMRAKTLLLSVSWFCTGLSFYTFAQYIGLIGGNIFLAVALSGIISAIGAMSSAFVITKTGRKTTVGIYQLLTAICFVMLLVVPKDLYVNNWPRLLFAGIGFAGMAGSIPALYLFSGELFPTIGRNVGVSGVTTFARIASMIAPAVVSLESFAANLPVILLTIVSFIQMIVLLPLPETKDTPLPNTLRQAEQF